jgi:glutathione S-transferase
MKLLYSPASPYARKVRIVISERRLKGIKVQKLNPLSSDASAQNPNPLGKIPTLILDRENCLFDSSVICAYLDTIGDTPSLMALKNKDKWRIARKQALGDGIMDAAFNLVMEGRRPEAERSTFWAQRWEAGIKAGVLEIANTPNLSAPALDIGQISMACALDYLDFRLPAINWRADYPAVKAWCDDLLKRPSFQNTAPAL